MLLACYNFTFRRYTLKPDLYTGRRLTRGGSLFRGFFRQQKAIRSIAVVDGMSANRSWNQNSLQVRFAKQFEGGERPWICEREVHFERHNFHATMAME